MSAELQRNGNCFKAAWQTLGKLEREVAQARTGTSIEMVHGLVKHPELGKYHAHAWVELGPVVVDYSNGNRVVMPAALYYTAGRIKPEATARYSRTAAMQEMARTEHYGPWAQHVIEGAELS